MMFKRRYFINYAVLVQACLWLMVGGCRTREKSHAEAKDDKSAARTDFFKPPEDYTEVARTSLEQDMLSTNGHGVDERIRDKTSEIFPDYSTESPVAPIHLSTEEKLPSALEHSEKIAVSLNFSGAALTDVIPVFAKMLKFDYLIDVGLAGNITISLEAELSPPEIWEVFKQILNIADAYYAVDAGIVKIRPHQVIPQIEALDRQQSNIEVGVFQLRYVASKDVIGQIGVFLSKGSKPIDMTGQNALLLVDTRENIIKAGELIRHLDKPSKFNWHRVVMPCYNVSASRVASELAEILPVLGFPVTTELENPTPGAIQLTGLDRLQIIVASAANREALEELGRWLRILDKTDVGEQERVFIYHVINGKADELVQALSVIFAIEGSTLSATASQGRTTAAAVAQRTPGATSISGGGRSEGRDSPASVFEIPVKMFADAVHNRLVVRTTPRTYAMMKALIEALDTVPSQVLLQVLVVEISLTDSTKFGMEFSAKGSGSGTGTITSTNYKNLNPGSKDSYGGQFWIFNSDDPKEKFGYIQALAGKTNVKVISSPQVLVASHTEAKISVGDKVPLVNSEVTNTQSTQTTDDKTSTNVVRNIQYQDTGIILEITPHVTRGGLITLDMTQTVSDAVDNKTSKIDSPIIQERILKTSMSIRDGQTIICGGLIKEKITDNLDTIPFIGDIPFLRRLIGDTDISKERTEMLILVTGYIINRETKLEELLKRYKQSVVALQDFHDRSHGNKPEEKKKSENKGFWTSWLFE